MPFSYRLSAIAIILILGIFVSVSYLFMDSNASNVAGIFVPSEKYISQVNAEAAMLDVKAAEKVFNEYTEATIDKMGFYIRIDKISLFKKVIKDVDPRYVEVYRKSWNYGVSHGKFTSYPDQIGLTYIYGHAVGNKETAVNDNAWFSNLDRVGLGDEVILYYEGKKYIYEVTEIREVSPKATGFYTGASPVSKLRLQYCGPPTGSLDMRTLVDALLIDTQSL